MTPVSGNAEPGRNKKKNEKKKGFSLFKRETEEERIERLPYLTKQSRTYGQEPPKFFLRHQRAAHKGMKTLVLDLDETLVHSSFQPIPNPDFIVKVMYEG